MSYYAGGDYTRGGGYYRGYYSAGGFWKSVLGAIGGVIRSPIGSVITSAIPGGGVAKAIGEAIGQHEIAKMQSEAVQAGPGPGPSDAAMASHPALGSMPGPTTQAPSSGAAGATTDSGGLPPMGGGTPGHAAHRHGLLHAGKYHRRLGGHRRRRAGGHRRRGGGRRRRRHYSTTRAQGDIRRASSGRFLTGHRFPARRRRKRGGGRVSFVTKDGRRVSFNAR